MLPRVPAELACWLLDKGSLTARLVAASGGEFRVQILQQRWQRPRFSERRLLGMADRDMAIVREVALLCHQQPWVFARSVLPASTLVGRLRHLRKFQDSALGALLFSDPGMQRDGYQIARIQGDDVAIPEVLRSEGLLWGRRSCFHLDSRPLMVSEIFLPGFNP